MGEGAGEGKFGAPELAALTRLNELRAGEGSRECAELEAFFDTRFGAASRLVVYGTLAPGESNHDQLADVPGEWTAGLAVRGELYSTEWSGMPGYPALRCSMEGPEVAVKLFCSPDLAAHWPRLDRFEGPGYRRVLVPVFADGLVIDVANIYQALAPEGEGG